MCFLDSNQFWQKEEKKKKNRIPYMAEDLLGITNKNSEAKMAEAVQHNKQIEKIEKTILVIEQTNWIHGMAGQVGSTFLQGKSSEALQRHEIEWLFRQVHRTTNARDESSYGNLGKQ
jgi:hypothetical protein